jgi:hypothetical protein
MELSAARGVYTSNQNFYSIKLELKYLNRIAEIERKLQYY